jgi:hypothetical protein
MVLASISIRLELGKQKRTESSTVTARIRGQTASEALILFPVMKWVTTMPSMSSCFLKRHVMNINV